MADFASRYISEVESGKGLFGGAKSALEGTSKDVGKKFSKENLVRSTFGGDDIFSALIRSKLGVKKKPEKEKEKAPTKEGAPEGGEGGGFPAEGISFLKIIAKNTMSLPWMARDMNVLRQNLQKLVKIKAGPQKKGVKAYATGADAYFLREDEREAALEAQRAKAAGGPKPAAGGEDKGGEGGGGLINTIVSFFSGGFMKAVRFIFNPKNLVKIFSKVFLPIAIIGSLFNGIMDGFKRYQETGSFSDAIVAGLGGVLKFITFGLFGEDTLKTLFDSISNFFAPITETISNVFNNIKNFIKGLFGGTVDVEDKGPKEAEKVPPTMPDTKQFTAEGVMASGDSTPNAKQLTTDIAKASGASDEKASDISGLFGSVQSGDTKGLFQKAQRLAEKYPEAPTTPTTPTPEGQVSSEQAQRNYDLNKRLTADASKMMGVPLSMPEPPSQVASATPSAPLQTTPSPSPQLSDSDKIKQLEGYIENNKTRFAKRESDAARHIDSFKKRYANDPERVRELENDYAQTLSVEKREMENANAGFQSQIDALKKSSKTTVTASSGASPSVEPSSPQSSASEVSGGGASSGGSSASSGSSAESVASAPKAPSGSDILQSSSQVAEGQRMESAADMGSVINAPTTNTSTASQGKPPNTIADAYDTEFAKLLATTA